MKILSLEDWCGWLASLWFRGNWIKKVKVF